VRRHCDGHLQVGSSKVRGHHSVILIRRYGAWIHDLDSTNGTFLNEERVTEDPQLNNGDRLQIGPLSVEVQIDPGAFELEEPAELKMFSDSDAADILLKPSDADILVGGEDRDYDSTVL